MTLGTLGLVLTPYGYVPGAYPFEINKSGPSEGSFLCPPDPYYFQRGEYGFFHDTPFGGSNNKRDPLRFLRLSYWQERQERQEQQRVKRTLGAIPTDAEIGKYYYSWYTPVQSGWVYTEDPNRFIPGPWVPPHNRNTASPFGPQTSLQGQGLAASILSIPSIPSPAATVEDIIRLLEKNQRDQFFISALAMTGTVLASAFTIFRTIQGIREDERRRATTG